MLVGISASLHEPGGQESSSPSDKRIAAHSKRAVVATEDWEEGDSPVPSRLP